MAPYLLQGLEKVVGSGGNDTFVTGAHQITYGLQGDDRFSAVSGSAFNVMVGGPGDDSYSTARNSTITIVDTGGYDTLYAYGLAVDSPYTYVAMLEGRHLIAADISTWEAVIIADAYAPGTQIEQVHLANGTYSLAEIQQIIAHAPNYLGHVSVRDVVEVGLLPQGTTSYNLQQALDSIKGHEAELIAAVSVPPAPEPPPAPGPQGDGHPGMHAAFYLSTYTDVAAAGLDPWFHYSHFGWHEGRDPNAFFHTSWYLAQNPDVAAAGVNPLIHYFTHGAREGRDPSAYFDSDWYLATNPDVAQAQLNPLHHYMAHGIREGRAPSPAVTAEASEVGSSITLTGVAAAIDAPTLNELS